MSNSIDTTTGSIAVGQLYTVTEARRRLGLGEWAFRKLRRAGLNVLYFGNRAYVLGDDLIFALKAHGSTATAVEGQNRNSAA